MTRWDVFWTVVAGLLVVAIVGVVTWLWKRRGLPLPWIRAKRAARATATRDEKRDELIYHVLARAKVLGKRLPVAAEGSHPVVVTYSDGSRIAFYGDLLAYKQAGSRGDGFNPLQSSHGSPPKTLRRWADDQLRQWLADHASDDPS